MRYTVVFKLAGALSQAAAVEWTDAAEPQASGAGWEPCVRLADGSWRMASYAGAAAHWRAPGPFPGIALRYRAEPAGPWSAISESRKEVIIVAVGAETPPVDPEPEPEPHPEPEARPRRPVLDDWDAFAVRLGNGSWTGVIVTRGAALGEVDRVDWLGVDPGRYDGEAALEAHFEPTVPFVLEGFAIPEGERWWCFASKAAIVHERAPGSSLNQIRFRYRLAGGPLLSPEAAELRVLNETLIREPATAPTTPPLPVPRVPPLLLAAPTLAGAGTIGTALAAAPGSWGGEPAPVIAFQWLRDGAPIAGATEAAYTPGPEDDLCAVACRVAAANPAGEIAALTDPVVARYAAPSVTGALFDEIFDEGNGAQAVEAAAVFAGANLAFAVSGAGATIDARTGLVSIPTDRVLSGEKVVVTAANSGGSVEADFLVTVEAAEVVVEEAPRQPVETDWDCFTVRLPNGTWTGVVVTRDAELGDVEQVDWIGVNVDAYPDALALEPHFEPTAAFALEGFAIPAGERWWIFASKAATVHERPPGSVLNQIRFRYRLAGGTLCSAHAANLRVLSEAQLVAPAGASIPETPAPTPAPTDGWRLMPIRSSQEKAAGLPGGEAMQFPHSAWRDPKNPDLIIWGQDMGSVWWSSSAIPSWNNSGNLGLWCYMIQAVAVHPVTGDWYAVGASAYEGGNRNLQGIYRKRASELGKTNGRWELVRQVDRVGHWRWFHETITFAPDGSVIVALNRRQTNDTRSLPADGIKDGNTIEQPGQIWRSASGDAGSWTQVGATLPVGTFGQFHALKHHPTNAGVMYLATTRGLLKTSNSGASWQWLSGQGGLPQGPVRNLAMNPRNGDQLYVPVSAAGTSAGVGVFYTGNAGGSFAKINTPAGATISKVFASPVDFGTASARLYLICRGQQVRTSGNNGGSWSTGSVPGRPGTGPSAWTSQIVDNPTVFLGFVLPHPTLKNEAIAQGNTAFHRTTDGGGNWADASHGFSGMAASQGTCWDFHNTDGNRFAMGIYDGGWLQTADGGQSFAQTGPNVTDPDNAGRHMHRSMHQIARLWESDELVATIGLIPGGFYTVRSTSPMSAGSYAIVPTGNGRRDYWFMRRHRLNENVIYHQNKRSLDRGRTWVNYGGGESFVMAMHHGNPDVLFSLRGSGPSTAIGWSGDRGASFQALVNVGWPVAYGDARFPFAFCPDVADTKAFWTVNGTPGVRDLARWSPSTGWKTDFNLRGLMDRVLPGGLPGNLYGGIGNIAVDPTDRNRVYVLVSLPGASRVLVTRNGWAASPSWEDVSGSLPMTPGGLLEINPVTREVFRATNGNGTYRLPFAA